MSIYWLMKWQYTGSITKSQQEVDYLAHKVLLADDFQAEDLSGFTLHTQNSILDTNSTLCTSEG